MSEEIKSPQQPDLSLEKIKGLEEDLQMLGQYLLFDIQEAEGSLRLCREKNQRAEGPLQGVARKTSSEEDEDRIKQIESHLEKIKELLEEIKVGKYDRTISYLKDQLEAREGLYALDQRVKGVMGSAVDPAHAEKIAGRLRVLREHIRLLEEKG